jgi:hypothetical protein
LAPIQASEMFGCALRISCNDAAATAASPIIALTGEFNRADDGTMEVYSEYLEVVVGKR